MRPDKNPSKSRFALQLVNLVNPVWFAFPS
jgi:hypothetical protein